MPIGNWLYDVMHPDPQKMAADRARVQHENDLSDREAAANYRAVNQALIGSYAPSAPRTPAPEFKIDDPLAYAPPVVGSGVRAPAPSANPSAAEIQTDPNYLRFVAQRSQAPAAPPAPVATQPAAPTPPPVTPPPQAAPIRMFTSPARDVSAGPTPDVPTYTNIGTRGDVVDLGGQQNVGGPADNGIDSQAYRNYLRNTGHLDEFEQEKAAIAESQAKEARSAALTADPFADQNRLFQLEALKTQLGITKDRAHLVNERDVKLGPMISQADADAKAARAKVDAIPGITPEQRAAGYAKAEELHQEALKEINKLATRSQTSAEIASAPLPGG